MRQYALAHLTAAGERDVARAAHAARYLALPEQASPELRGPDQVAWLARLAADQDNLRAALHWAEERGDLATAARLAVALTPFWEVHGTMSEGRGWLANVLAGHSSSALPVPLRSWAPGRGRAAGVLAGRPGPGDDAARGEPDLGALGRRRSDRGGVPGVAGVGVRPEA